MCRDAGRAGRAPAPWRARRGCPVNDPGPCVATTASMAPGVEPGGAQQQVDRRPRSGRNAASAPTARPAPGRHRRAPERELEPRSAPHDRQHRHARRSLACPRTRVKRRLQCRRHETDSDAAAVPRAQSAPRRDALLLYRLGDFYELFFEDAEPAAPMLGLVLTRRRHNDEVESPMCGIPHHALAELRRQAARGRVQGGRRRADGGSGGGRRPGAAGGRPHADPGNGHRARAAGRRRAPVDGGVAADAAPRRWPTSRSPRGLGGATVDGPDELRELLAQLSPREAAAGRGRGLRRAWPAGSGGRSVTVGPAALVRAGPRRGAARSAAWAWLPAGVRAGARRGAGRRRRGAGRVPALDPGERPTHLSDFERRPRGGRAGPGRGHGPQPRAPPRRERRAARQPAARSSTTR